MGKSVMCWSGGVIYTRRDGVTVQCLPGWPACSSGARAEKTRKEGSQTNVREDVTCAVCKVRLAWSDQDAKKEKANG